MSNIATTPVRSIDTITAEIVAISNQAAQMVYMSMIEIGKRLVEAKAQVGHGEWGDYLKNKVNFSQRTATNFMRAYERSLNGANSQTFANLGYSQIVKLLALPEGELEEFTETHDVKSMSVRELDQAIKERDEARSRVAAAEAAARDAEQKLLNAQHQAAAAKDSEEAWKKEIEKLNASLNKATAAAEKAKKQVKELKANPTIPDAVKEQLIAEATAKAADSVRAELQGQIDAATQAAENAAKEKAAAEAAAQDAKDQLANVKKSNQLANPDIASFNLLAKQIQNDVNRLNGYRLKIAAANPETAEKMKKFELTMLEELRKKVEGQ